MLRLALRFSHGRLTSECSSPVIGKFRTATVRGLTAQNFSAIAEVAPTSAEKRLAALFSKRSTAHAISGRSQTGMYGFVSAMS